MHSCLVYFLFIIIISDFPSYLSKAAATKDTRLLLNQYTGRTKTFILCTIEVHK